MTEEKKPDVTTLRPEAGDAKVYLPRNFSRWIIKDTVTGRNYSIYRTPKGGVQMIGIMSTST